MRLIVALAFLVISQGAAASTEGGFVVWVSVRASDGLIYFGLDQPLRAGRPGCATQGYWVIRDETSANGQRQFDLIARARDGGLRVRIIGANPCSRWPDAEDVEIVQFGSNF